MLSKLARSYPDQYGHTLALAAVPGFWESVRADDPRLVGNPVAALADRSKVLPLWVHGDGVAFSTDSLMLISFGSVLSLQSSLDSSLLVAAWPKAATDTGSWEAIWPVVAWSLRACWDGRHPHVNWAGEPFARGSEMEQLAGQDILPNGWRAVLWQVQGDLEWFANHLGLPHWRSDNFCWWCDGLQRGLARSVWNFTEQAEWRCHSPQHMAAQPSATHPLLTAVPGPPAGLRALPDMLHTVDLGFAVFLLGSVLHLWCFGEWGAVGAPPAGPERCAQVWGAIREAYQAMGIRERLNNLTLGMFADARRPWAQTPVLSCHAAEARHLVPAMAVVARRWHDGTVEAGHICEALQQLGIFYELLESAGLFLDARQAAAALAAMRGALTHHAWLHTRYGIQDEASRFPLRPKLHWSLHIAEFARFQNPRSWWHYRAEDWVGRIATVAHSVAHGTRAIRIAGALVQKYRFLLHLRLVRGVCDDP
jgi:hypothetical protein